MDLETAIKLVEGYIFEKKGVQVTIDKNQFNTDPLSHHKLEYALGFAQEYFNSKETENEQRTNN